MKRQLPVADPIDHGDCAMSGKSSAWQHARRGYEHHLGAGWRRSRGHRYRRDSLAVAAYQPKVRIEVANAWASYDTHRGDWCASINAINSGSAAVTLAGFGYRFPDGGNLISTRSEPGSALLPHRLEPHVNATFLMSAEGILHECSQRGVDPSALKSWVRLQTGKIIFGPPPPIEADD